MLLGSIAITSGEEELAKKLRSQSSSFAWEGGITYRYGERFEIDDGISFAGSHSCASRLPDSMCLSLVESKSCVEA